MFEIRKIYLVPALKVAAVLGVAAGVVLFAVYSLVFGSNSYYYSNLVYLAENLGIAFLVCLLGSALGAVLMALVAVPVYNFLAEEFGGVTIDLNQVTEDEG